MANDLYIRGMVKGSNKRFKKNLNEVALEYPNKPVKWWIGVAVHITCQQNGKGTAEYRMLDPKQYDIVKYRWVDAGMDWKQVNTIKPSTIRNKYRMFCKEVINAA